MKKKSRSKTKRNTTRSVLRLPDLEHAKTAVLNSLTSPDAQRGQQQGKQHTVAFTFETLTIL